MGLPYGKMWDAEGVPVGATNPDGSPYTKVDPNGPGALGTGASQGDFPTDPKAFGDVDPKKAPKAFNPLDRYGREKGVSWSGPDPRGDYQSGRINNTPESEQKYNAPRSQFRPAPAPAQQQQQQQNNLMALAQTYAGPVGVSKGGRFGAKYLQARLYGMSKATVNPRVNQLKTMNSPEFAAAKAMGLSVPYSSGGESMVDVTGAELDLQNATKTGDRYGQRNAQARLDRFDQGMIDSGGDTAMYDSGLTPSPRRIPKATRSASELPAINDGSQDIDSEYAGMDSGSDTETRTRGNGAGLTDDEARGRSDRYSPIGQRTR